MPSRKPSGKFKQQPTMNNNKEIDMLSYQVTIEFKRGPSFSMQVEAFNDRMAINIALPVARACGFNEAVKKSRAVEIVGTPA